MPFIGNTWKKNWDRRPSFEKKYMKKSANTTKKDRKSKKPRSKRPGKPGFGPDVVLGMNRGRTFADRKKKARKEACRKFKQEEETDE